MPEFKAYCFGRAQRVYIGETGTQVAWRDCRLPLAGKGHNLINKDAN